MTETLPLPLRLRVEATNQRVRIVEYIGSTTNKYVGLEGVVTEMFLRHDRLMVLVKLDNDPAPILQSITGGLPCLPHEIEVI